MAKKIMKVLIFVAGILAILGSILYLVKKFSKKDDVAVSAENKQEDDSLDAGDAIDFSGLKFSRNYVDLR